MDDMNQVLGELQGSIQDLQKEYPDFMKAFHGFMDTTENDGAISKKNKEIICVSLSVVKQCKWCIAFHVKNALNAGASKEELMEASFVAALMGGGPAMMYAQLVVKAIKDFSN